MDRLHPGLLSPPQPTVVTNTGLGWQVATPTHYQLTLTHGPFHANEYRLVQYQMHWPSEHTLEGRSYPGELHLVHIHTRYRDLEEAKLHSEGVAVVAVLITEDKETANSELEKIGEVLPRIQLKGEQAQTAEVVRVEGLLPRDRDYLTYRGSLTTPGFEEGVVWAVLLQPLAVSPAALSRMRQLRYGGEDSTRVGANCREQQDLGERTVYRPDKQQGDSSNHLGLTHF